MKWLYMDTYIADADTPPIPHPPLAPHTHLTLKCSETDIEFTS